MTTGDPDGQETLRAQVMSGGAVLVLRQVASILIGIVGLVLVTRLIGPANYGYYAGTLAVVLVLNEVATFGTKVYLVRLPRDSGTRPFRQAMGLLMLSGLLVMALAAGVVISLGDSLVQDRERPALLLMLLSLPLTIVGTPSFALLERDLDFRTVAIIEFVNDLVFYAVTLPLAFLGFDLWAPVLGYLAMQAYFLGRSTRASGLGLRPASPSGFAAGALRFGVGYSAGQWVFFARRLVNPVVVGAALGPAAVGIVALGIRAAETLTFVAQATIRLSVAAFARIKDDTRLLKSTVEEGTSLQLLAAGPLLAGFAAAAPLITPVAFGDQWNPLLEVFPLIALGFLATSASTVPIAALYVLDRNGDVFGFQVVRLLLFVATAAVCVPLVGLVGYGLGEAVSLAGLVYLHGRMRASFAISYRHTGPLFIGWALAICAPLLPTPEAYLLWLVPIAVMLLPAQRRQLGEYVGYVRTQIPVGRFRRARPV